MARSRVATSVTTIAVGSAASVQSFTYDLDGKVESVALDGIVIADPVYAASQLLQSVSYSNGTSLSSITRNAAGATTGIGWGFPAVATVASTVNQPAVVSYTTGFEAGVDGWAATAPATIAPTTTVKHAGTAAVGLTQTSAAAAVASRTITGLTVGRSYTVEAWFATDRTSASSVSTQLGIVGIGDTASVVAAPAVGTTVTWAKITYTFIATATSHALRVQGSAPSGDANVLVDDGR
jgi:large repetitive protein